MRGICLFISVLCNAGTVTVRILNISRGVARLFKIMGCSSGKLTGTENGCRSIFRRVIFPKSQVYFERFLFQRTGHYSEKFYSEASLFRRFLSRRVVISNFGSRSQNLIFLLKVGSKELCHAATGDLKNGGRGVKRGSWPPDIPIPPFQVSAPPRTKFHFTVGLKGGGLGFWQEPPVVPLVTSLNIRFSSPTYK